MSTIFPIINQPSLYITGMKVYYISTTTLGVEAGQCRDSTNGIDMNLGNYLGYNPNATANTTTTINGAVNGVNGLDTGTLAASTWYYIYAIADQSGYNQPATVISKSSTGPLLPSITTNPGISATGYSSWRMIGATLTDGSSHFLKFFQVGHLNQRNFQWDASISVLSAGHSTTGAAVDLSVAAPVLLDTTAGTGPIVYLGATYTPNTAGNTFALQPTGGTALPITGSGVVTTAAQVFPSFSMISGIGSSKPEITYTVTNASDSLSLSVTGYTIFV
jgi:hypothetical protein